MLGIAVNNNTEMSQIGKSRVRRCLFGPPDHASIKRDLNKALEESNLEGKNRWNFDFCSETPIDGRYRWEVVSDSEYIPEFYRKGYVPRKPVKISRGKCFTDIDTNSDSDSDSNGDIRHVCDDSETDILAKPLVYSSDEEELSSHDSKCNKTDNSQNMDNSSSENSSNTLEKNLVQSQISDFMKKRKRIVGASTLTSKSKLRRLDL